MSGMDEETRLDKPKEGVNAVKGVDSLPDGTTPESSLDGSRRDCWGGERKMGWPAPMI